MVDPARNDPIVQSVDEAVWAASFGAAIAAGLVAGTLFWRLRKERATSSQGALIGIWSTFASYGGIAIGAAFAFALTSISEGRDIGDVFGLAAVMSLVCGGASALITGSVAFPVMAIVGIALSKAQPAAFKT
jgi:hypothetical protein